MKASGSAQRSLTATLLAVGAASVLLLNAAATVRAAEPFPQFAQICPTGEAGGQCAQASGLASSPINGNVFEVDARNNRVQEFTPWGQFVKAFGWGVVASGPGNKPQNEIQQLTVSATGGTFKLRYGIPASFTAAETAAIAFEPGIKPTAEELKAALVGAPFPTLTDPFLSEDLSVSGPAGGPWNIESTGRYADTDFGGGSFVLETKSEGLSGGGASATLTVTQDGGNYEICVPADGDVCRAGSPGSHPGQFGGNPGSNIGPQGIAVDSSGNVYVVDRKNHRVQKYGSAGTFLLMFGGSVNQTTGEDLCTAAQIDGGDVCVPGTIGTPGPGEGEFGTWASSLGVLGDFIDVGPDDTVYVGDSNRIQHFSSEGVFLDQISGAVAGEIVQSLDIGPKGELYVTFVDASASTNVVSKANVRHLNSSGTELGQLTVANPRGLATDSEGNLYVVDTNFSLEQSKVLGFTVAGSAIDLNPDAPSLGVGEGVLKEGTGITTTNAPTCGLTSPTLTVGSYSVFGSDNSINIYGGTPDPDICPQPKVPPTILTQFAASVDTESATLKARINPHFWPDTRYFVEYGTDKCSDGNCTSTQPTPPGSLLTAEVLDVGVFTNAVVLTDLQPGTRYHYRFVADSDGGDPVVGEEGTFITSRGPSSEAGCPNDLFRTGRSAALPDCRAYELVSPFDKGSGDVARTFDYNLTQADLAGLRMSFSSQSAFAGPEGAPLSSQYLAERQSDGWATRSISPPRSVPTLYPLGAATEGHLFKALSADLCSGWVLQDNPTLLTSAAPVGVPNLYRRDNCGKEGYELITSSPPAGFWTLPYKTFYFPTVQGFSDDSSRTVFRANAALVASAGGPRAPFSCFVASDGGSISYRWLRDGAPIGGATQSTYTYVAADIGKTLQCQVTATASGRTSIAASETVQVVPAPHVAPPNPGAADGSLAIAGTPSISGLPEVGATLTCKPGPWKGDPSFSYQWLRDGSAVAGATEATYEAAPADDGAGLQCRLTGTNAGGSAVAFSRSIAIGDPEPAIPQPRATTHANFQLYVASGSALRLASVLPNGAAISGESASAGTAWSIGQASNAREDAVYRALSDDAERIFWTATVHKSPTENGTGPGKLYLRLNAMEPQSAISGGKCTEITKACTISVSPSDAARFVSANPQGSRVVYMTGVSDPAEGLQLFTGEVDVSGGEPTISSELIAAGVRGVMGASEDASRIYFVSRNVLSSEPNDRGDEAVVGQPNLYFYEEGADVDFVATLAANDAREGEARPGQLSAPSPVAVGPNLRTSRVSPDGLHLAFTSVANLTGYDNSDATSDEANAEVYRYAAGAGGDAGELLCVSCNPSGARPSGRLVHGGIAGPQDDLWVAAMIPGWNSEYQPTRALANNGKRIFFNAYDSLVPGDSNGRADVYQWEASGEGGCTEESSAFSQSSEGCVRLISSGQGSDDAEFLDATPSGSDVFFNTSADLVAGDYGQRDVYDARVYGGFASRTSPGQGCQGDACQHPLAPPQSVTPASASFSGPGNVRPAPSRNRCPKGRGKARRGGKTVCVKNRKAGKKKHSRKGGRAGAGTKGGAR